MPPYDTSTSCPSCGRTVAPSDLTRRGSWGPVSGHFAPRLVCRACARRANALALVMAGVALLLAWWMMWSYR